MWKNKIYIDCGKQTTIKLPMSTWLECKAQAEAIARETFYSPGVFNDEKFAKDFALFLILRKQCMAFHKRGKLNIPLAMNNLVIAINSFGQASVNQIIRVVFEPHLAKTAITLLAHLEADTPRATPEEIDDTLSGIIQYGGFNRPPLHMYY